MSLFWNEALKVPALFTLGGLRLLRGTILAVPKGGLRCHRFLRGRRWTSGWTARARHRAPFSRSTGPGP